MTERKPPSRGRASVEGAPINPWRLKQFVLTVEAPTLAVAASSLFVTPQALSTSLRKLERELSVELFQRDSRTLRLTSAGKTLYNGARAVLTGNELLAQQVRRVDAGRAPVLSVGYTPAVLPYEVYRLMAPVLKGSCRLRVRAHSVDSSTMLKPLVSGEVNVVFRRGAQVIEGFETEVLAYDRLNVAVSVDSDLASRNSIGLRDIGDRPIVVPAPERISAFTDSIVAKCHSSGFSPKLMMNPIFGLPPYTATMDDPTVCTFTAEPPGTVCGGSVKVIAVEETILSPMQMIWLPGTVPNLRGMMAAGHPLPAKEPIPGS